jgi:hypothetical protein
MSGTEAKPFGAKEFRAELVKIMPGYSWTVHKSRVTGRLVATGIKSAGSNRLSTLRVTRDERYLGDPRYEAKSAGFGLRAPWLHTSTGATLARALRTLQEHYEWHANNYRAHAMQIQSARTAEAVRQ